MGASMPCGHISSFSLVLGWSILMNVPIWLKYCWKGCKIVSYASIHLLSQFSASLQCSAVSVWCIVPAATISDQLANCLCLNIVCILAILYFLSTQCLIIYISKRLQQLASLLLELESAWTDSVSGGLSCEFLPSCRTWLLHLDKNVGMFCM